MIKEKFVFLFFHLNLFFSSLPENKKKDVINKCYWPLLNLIDNSKFKIGIEITGWTLNEIYKLDSSWIYSFKKLLEEKKTYLIGSSYTQAIFPLIPNDVNNYNIKYGIQIYKDLLNFIPKIAYVNEQCFSKSLVDLFKCNNYQTLIMDWDCIKNNSNLNHKLKYFPQILKGNKKTIDVIWNSSTNFQNFQKIIHDKLDENEYFQVFEKSNSFKEGLVNIYGSDAEIFDFRLKRFENESKIKNNTKISEWSRIHKVLSKFEKKFIYLNLNDIKKIKFNSKFSYNKIDITSADNILPTKKQKKYNPLRWYVGGQNNYLINTLCWNLYSNSKNNTNKLKLLCFFWSSDFRTHIESKRWKNVLRQIKKESQNFIKTNNIKYFLKKNLAFNKKKIFNYHLEKQSNHIIYDDGKYFFKLDKVRGLTLSSFGLIIKGKYHNYIQNFNQGTFYKDKLNTDFYCGHTVLENSKSKYSDLDDLGDIKVEKINNFIILSNNFIIKDNLAIKKKWYFDLNTKTFYLHNKISIKNNDFLSIRSNYFNLNYKTFDLNQLKISTKNGGSDNEYFKLNKSKNFYYDEAISPKFSAQSCFGNTDGEINIFDNNKSINFKLFHKFGTMAPMICFEKDKNKSYFFRVLMSFQENSDSNTIYNQPLKSNFESLLSINIS